MISPQEVHDKPRACNPTHFKSHGTIDLYHNSSYRLALSTYSRFAKGFLVQVQYMGFVLPSGALIFA